MSMKEQILSIAMQDPRFQETITVIEQQLSGTNMVAEDLTEAIQMLEYVLQNPEVYPEVRTAAIKDGLIDEGMFPPQFDEVLIISLLVVLYGMQDRLSQQGYARGGLAVSGKQLARMGQGGDRQLAHINDREAEVLRRMGGQGTVNPNTGLREYKGLKNVLKVALPIALSFVAPVLAPTIGAAVLGSGASALAQGVVGGAILGGGTSLLTGGDPLVGAVSGGLGGFAPGISESLAQQFPNLSESAIRAIGGGATGALGSALTGSDPVRGAAYGAIGSLAKPFVQDMTQRASTYVNNQMQANAATSGTMKPVATTGASTVYQPAPGSDQNIIFSQALEMPGYGNPQYADFAQPIDLPFDEFASMLDPQYESTTINPMTAQQEQVVDPFNTVEALNEAAESNQSQGEGFAALRNLLPEPIANLLPDDLSMTELGLGALGLAALSGLSEQDQMDISMAETDGIFDKTTNQYDFVKIRGEANQRGMTLGQFLSSPFFKNDQSKYYMNNDTMYAAEGGIMDAPGYVSGPGDGRDDVINARLSDGEYVIDAESVSLLGDGSNKAGAEMLDDMRKKLRMHKGKVLAKGRFSPDAKSPLEYMRRSA
tara:strand:- start:1033 stop:2826 length:1794 start_codon:yes stop_codon:yes gene_type:complete